MSAASATSQASLPAEPPGAAFHRPVLPDILPKSLVEFFSNSALVPMSVLLLEILLEKGAAFTTPDPYVLFLAALVQTALLGRSQLMSAAGLAACNLAGFAIYALIEGWIEGWSFFEARHHLLYAAYSAIFAGLAILIHESSGRMAKLLVLTDSFFRATIPLAMYAVFEAIEQGVNYRAVAFWNTPNHLFLLLNTVLLGMLLGLARVGEQGARAALTDLSAQLYRISVWTIGEAALSGLLGGGAVLARVERAIIFIDIRGFTAWSESTAPEAVVEMLNHYYGAIAEAASNMHPLRIKFSADEAMLVCTATPTLKQLLTLSAAASSTLGRRDLGVGIGLHTGTVVEGLFGTGDHKVYDVIGDAANVANRLCAAAGRGEVVLSATTLALIEGQPRNAGSCETLSVKGKSLPLEVVRICA